MTTSIPLRWGETARQAQLTPLADGGYQLSLDGEPPTVGGLQWLGPHHGLWRTAERVTPFFQVRQGPDIWVWVAGQVARFSRGAAPGASGGGAVPGGLGPLCAEMPGTVLQVPVAAGQSVSAGQPLVILESMKMELTLSAPQAALVARVSVSVGQRVELGAELLHLEPLAAPEAPNDA